MHHQRPWRFLQTRQGSAVIDFLILAVIIVFLFGGFLMLRSQSVKNRRDLDRLATVRRAQVALSSLYLARGSYRSAATGCGTIGDLLSQCSFSAAGVNAMELSDPGKHRMTIATVPNDETYAITFTLERSHGTLRVGRHTLSPAGIQ